MPSYKNRTIGVATVAINPRVEDKALTIDRSTGAILRDGGLIGNPTLIDTRPRMELPAIAEETSDGANLLVLILAFAAAWYLLPKVL